MTLGQYPALTLGESGTAFATGLTAASEGGDVNQIVSFVLNSGSANWSYQAPPGATASIIAATDAGGLVAKIRGATDSVIRFDGAGNGTFDGAPTNPLTNVDFLYKDTFIGNYNTQTILSSSGQLVNVSPNVWPRPAGNRQLQHAASKPEVVTFLPSHLDFPPPNTHYDISDFYSEMLATVPSVSEKNTSPRPVTTKAIQKFLDSNDARVQKFTAEVVRPLDVLAFLGHGVVKNDGSPNEFSYGLWFYYPTSNPPFADPTAPYDVPYTYLDSNGSEVTQYLPFEPNWNDHKIISLEEDVTKVVGLGPLWQYQNDQWAIRNPSIFLAGKLAPQAKIMFFASCSLNPSFGAPGEIPPFVQMWDVHDISIDGTVENRVRAMIVPDTPIGSNVLLAAASKAWIQILKNLVQGATVGDAVAQANTVPGAQQFKVLGNHGIKLKSE